MNKEDKKLQKHLVDEMMKVSQTNPDVMYYMEILMRSYEELEQKNIDLSQQLLSKKISDKDIEYKKRKEAEQELDKYKNIVDELILTSLASRMTKEEFECMWKVAYNKEYNPDDIKEIAERHGILKGE